VHLIPVGSHALLAEVASPHHAVALAAWARDRTLARDVVPGAETVLFDGVVDPDALRAALDHWEPGEGPPGLEVEIPMVYDGPDLETVAASWGCDADEVAARHQAAALVSAFCGFAPGFAYLSGLEGSVPRLATPRTRVPVGSVALAGTWCGVYPVASPGGWQIIGTTDAVLWNPRRAEPALLAPGTHVRFVAR